ncbi:hypothetical protein TNCV_4161641 [Trichonephila clavipes]|nr:hypothetical protein TNCV_4161641 [Trichonephila clavipes]
MPYIFLNLIGNKRELLFPRKTPKKISGKRFRTDSSQSDCEGSEVRADITDNTPVNPDICIARLLKFFYAALHLVLNVVLRR